jgi:hypothetical protein
LFSEEALQTLALRVHREMTLEILDLKGQTSEDSILPSYAKHLALTLAGQRNAVHA